MSFGENQTTGVKISTREFWDRFDRLSPAMRKLVASARYDYIAPRPETAPADFVEFVFRDRDRTIAKTYGPDHPQIGSRAPAFRRRR